MKTNSWKFMQNKILVVKIILGIVALIVLFIIGFTVWLFRPIKEVPPCELFPSSAFSFFFLNLNQSNTGLSEIMAKAKDEVLNTEMGFAKKTLFKIAFPSVIPKSLVGVLSIAEDSDEPDLVFIVSMGKIVRLIKIFGGSFDTIVFQGAPSQKQRELRHNFKSLTPATEKRGPSAYTIVGNNIVIGTSLSSVKDAYRSHIEWAIEHPAKAKEDARRRYFAEMLRQASMQRDASLYVDNNDGALSKIFQTVEEKFAFAAFPSIDAVATIKGEVRILTEEVTGNITFYCSESERLRDVRSDVKFIYGALRRKLRASDIDMKGTVQIEGNTVEFDFQIPDFIDSIFSNITSDQGDT
jgi:hypothetical protein